MLHSSMNDVRDLSRGEADHSKEEITPVPKFSQSDYTGEAFLNRLMKGFQKAGGSRPTTTITGRSSRQISTKHAQRITQALVDSLKFLKDYKFGEVTNFRSNQRSSSDIDKPDVKLAKFDLAIRDSLDLCQMTISERHSSIRVDQYTRKIIEKAQVSSNPEFILYSLYIQGKICMARCEFRQAIAEFKHFKELCSTYNVFSRRLYAYKMLGVCYQNLKMHKAALIYFTKFLYMSWSIDSPKHELLAYDFIGLQYYYLGILDKAEYFHNRMVGGKLEPKTSRIRHIGITKIRMNKTSSHGLHLNGNKNFEFDADLELEMQWSQNADKNFREDDEAAEVSGRDEGFEPPMSNVEDDFESRYRQDSRRMEIMAKKTAIKSIPGFVKAKVTLLRKTEAKEKKRGSSLTKGQSESNSSMFPANNLFRINARSGSSCFQTQKPNEQIFTSHLSRNRGLKNFSVLGANHSSYCLDDKNGYSDDLDSKSSEQVKRIMEKMRGNLEVIMKNLESVYKRPDEDYYY